ncbi:MAG: bifunctional folylpolyglutamate synthase/dihydrofolate synthase [Oscillospiraceae bacterium]|nr:bifunctional folylpolyglutamate synthase/dihydrofolate synthase [Oscillospiraceae bacterium]
MNSEVSDFLNRYTKSGVPVKDLSRFSGLAERLGNPQKGLKFVHIAGTNGKGSVTRMIAAALINAGYTVGEFTSPYIFSYNDRIRVNGENIPDTALSSVMDKVKAAVCSDGYSQFEITTAAAFLYFTQMKCDIVVLETGLGGLLDCTNIITENICAVITSISLDHTAVLGETVSEIARHKAGIIKNNCPVVLSPHNPEDAVKVVSEQAINCGSRLIIPKEDNIKPLNCDYKGNTFIYKDTEYTTAMPGMHQITNAVTAIEACGVIKEQYPRLTPKAVQKGISEAVMPSRCQVIKNSAPITIIDGAHNPDGMKALAEFIAAIPNSPKIMVCGMSADKDWQTALGYISPYIDKAFCVEGFTKNTVPSEQLCRAFSHGESVSVAECIEKAKAAAGKDGLLLICGSLYLRAELGGI